uniref:Integrase catalytic domain-containing protein n=1 Tax=Tanacetum cinerariifolium TaxID=118510 RepID=A0A6L2M6H6_TANCI|nr:hypothetical protein [Tanacetum cinerariifolium]
MIQVRLKVPVRRIQTDNGTKFVNQTLCEYYEQVGISHETSVARSRQQNSVVERQAVAIACFTQNRSMMCLHHGKTPYDLLYNRLSDLSYFYVFGALCYPTNDSKNLGKLQPKANIGIFIGYVPIKKAFRIYNRRTRRIIETIHEMTPTTISSGLVPNPTSSTPFVPSLRTDWDLLFQSQFDELLTPPPSVDHPAPEVIPLIAEVVVLELAASTSLPSSTTVHHDVPSPSNSQSTPKIQPPIIPNDVEEDNHDIEVAHMSNDSYFGLQISQSPKGIFINQSKYALESLKKYGFESCDPVDTPTVEKSKLDENKEGKAVDPSYYPDADHAGCQDIHRSTSGSLTKHINIKYHFIKEHVENGVIELYFVNTEYQLADIFTKALSREIIEFLFNKLGMRSFTLETLQQLTDEVDE